MQYLLDTHALIWFLEDDPQLSRKARTGIMNSNNECFISIASIWEIAVKVSINKLQLKSDFHKISDFLSKTEIEILPVELKHLEELLKMEFHHRDPFDRVIIAQAYSENLIIITKDTNFNRYKQVQLFW